jgi:hypothetical protein
MRLPRVREIPAALQSGGLAAIVPLLVRLMPLPAVFSLLHSKSTGSERSSFNGVNCFSGFNGLKGLSANELARIAGAAARLGPRFGVGECLVRSLVLYNLLRRAAFEPVLLIGGRLVEGRLDCHCWIEVDGKSINESNDPRKAFKLLYRFET